MPVEKFYLLPPFRNSNSEFKKFLADPGLMATWEEAYTAPDQEVSGSPSLQSQRSRNANQRLAHAFPTPCILGDSPDAICKFSEWFYWIAQLKYVYNIRSLDEDAIPVEFPNGLAIEGLSYSVKKNKSQAFHFCPIAIFRASDQPFGCTSSVVICLYRTKARRLSFREEVERTDPPGAKVKASCEPVDFIFLPTLQNTPLKRFSQRLARYGITVQKLSSLRKILQEQIYLLFGIIPSFLFLEKNTKKLPDTIQLHPTVAYFWSLGLHTQGWALSHKDIHFSPEPIVGAFLTPEEDERLKQQTLAESEICNSFANTFRYQYLTVQNSLTGFLTHCCIQPGITPPNGIKIKAASFLALADHRADRCLSLRSVHPGDNLSFSPVPVLLSPFFMEEHQQDLLARGLTQSAQKWLLYASRNNSCTFLTAALLYSICGEYLPGALSPHSEVKDAIPLLKIQPLLTLEYALVPENASSPLLQTNSFWQVFNEKKGTSLDLLFKRLSKAPRKLCIVLFQEPRTLTAYDCFRFLPYASTLLLGNVRLPEECPSVSISLRELGTFRKEGLTDDQNSSAICFPNQNDLFSLQMISDRLINFYAWVEANHRLLQIHWKASKNYCKTLAKIRPADAGSDVEEYLLRYKLYKRISLAIKRSKNDPKSILRIPEDTTLTRFSELCSEQDLKPYLPYLSLILLLSQAPTVLDHMPTVSVPDTLPEDPSFSGFSGYFSELNKVLPLRKTLYREIQPYLTNYFLQFCWRSHAPDGSPIIFQSKEEYLRYSNANCLGWVEDGKLYLAYDRYWDAFIQTTPWPLVLKDCRNRFQREILQPVLSKALVRENEKSSRWYCRPTIMKDGKQVRIGNFLVLRRDALPRYLG